MESSRRAGYLVLLLILAVGTTLHAEETSQLTEEQLTAIAGLPKVRGRANPRLAVERSPSVSLEGTMTITPITPSMKVDTWVIITPDPPELGGQDQIEVTPSISAEPIVDHSPLKRPLLRSRVSVESPDQEKTISYTCKYKAQLYSRSLKTRSRRSERVEELSDRERQIFLRPDATCDYTSDAFKTWKESKQFARSRRESEIDFAKRVFRTITNSYDYLYEVSQDRTASKLCQTNQTDCGGLSILFTTVMRSEAIPARLLVGRQARSIEINAGTGERKNQYHVIAEFYAEDIGWVPVDGANAVLGDPTPQKLEFFGNIPGDFLTLHIDTDLAFDTGLWGDHTERFFQMPKFWFRGKGKFDDVSMTHDWQVTTTETPKAASKTGKPNAASSDNRAFVFLPITHVRQEHLLCAPTSASMVLLHYGVRMPPRKVKQLANSVASDKSFAGTYFKDITAGLESAGLRWKERGFPTNSKGFSDGLAEIEKSLRRGYPVIIDTLVPPDGHTVVVNGIDPNRRLISIVDPNIPAPGLRRLSYVEFERLWRSVIANIRGCILTAPPIR